MFDKLSIYQTRFWLENKTVKIIEKNKGKSKKDREKFKWVSA